MTHNKIASAHFEFPKEEEKVLAYWREIDAFRTQLKLSEQRPRFSFFDGPPFATGLPHYGHILAGTIKVYMQHLLWSRRENWFNIFTRILSLDMLLHRVSTLNVVLVGIHMACLSSTRLIRSSE